MVTTGRSKHGNLYLHRTMIDISSHHSRPSEAQLGSYMRESLFVEAENQPHKDASNSEHKSLALWTTSIVTEHCNSG